MLTIAKTFEFAASHRLVREEWSDEANFAAYGKCANKSGHGHNYKLEVCVGGEINPETGMVIDASKIEFIVKTSILDELDHKHLNFDVSWLKGKVPTSEVLVEAIWERLEPLVKQQAPNAQLQKLVLWETSRIYAAKERDR